MAYKFIGCPVLRTVSRLPKGVLSVLNFSRLLVKESQGTALNTNASGTKSEAMLESPNR